MIEQPGFCVKKFEETYLLKRVNPFAKNEEQRHISFSHLDCECGKAQNARDITAMKNQMSQFLEKWEDMMYQWQSDQPESYASEDYYEGDDLRQDTSASMEEKEEPPVVCKPADVQKNVEIQKSNDVRNNGEIQKLADVQKPAAATNQAKPRMDEVEKQSHKPGSAIAEQCLWNVAHVSGKPTHSNSDVKLPAKNKDTPSTSSTKTQSVATSSSTVEQRAEIAKTKKKAAKNEKVPNVNQLEAENNKNTSTAKTEKAVPVEKKNEAGGSVTTKDLQVVVSDKQITDKDHVASANTQKTAAEPEEVKTSTAPLLPVTLAQEEPISVACTEETASLPSPLTQDGISPAITDNSRTAGTPDSGMISDVSEFKNMESEKNEVEDVKEKDPAKMTGRDGRRYRKKLEAERLAAEQSKLEEENEKAAEEDSTRASTESEPTESEAAVMTGKEKRRLKDKQRKEKKEQEKQEEAKKKEQEEQELAKKKEQEEKELAKKKEQEEQEETKKKEEEKEKEAAEQDEPEETPEDSEATEPSAPPEPSAPAEPTESGIGGNSPTDNAPSTSDGDEAPSGPALGAVDLAQEGISEAASIDSNAPNLESYSEVAEEGTEEAPKKMSKSQKKRAYKRANKGVYVVNENGKGHSVELLPGEYKIVKLDQSPRKNEDNASESGDGQVDVKMLGGSSKLQNFYVAGNLSKDILDNGKWLAYVIDEKNADGTPRIGEVDTEEVEKTIRLLDSQLTYAEQRKPTYVEDFDYNTLMTDKQAEEFVNQIAPELDADHIRRVLENSDQSGAVDTGAGESLCPIEAMMDDYLPDLTPDDLETYLTCGADDVVFRTEFARKTASLFVGNDKFKEFCLKYAKSKFNPNTIHALIKKYIDARIVYLYERFKKLADYDARRLSARWAQVSENSPYALMVMFFIHSKDSGVDLTAVEKALFPVA